MSNENDALANATGDCLHFSIFIQINRGNKQETFEKFSIKVKYINASSTSMAVRARRQSGNWKVHFGRRREDFHTRNILKEYKEVRTRHFNKSLPVNTNAYGKTVWKIWMYLQINGGIQKWLESPKMR